MVWWNIRTRIDRTRHHNCRAAKRLCWIFEKQKMDGKSMSWIDWRRTIKQMLPNSSPAENTCDSIHRYSNPAIHYDDPVLRYIADRSDSEMLAAECSDGILGKHCWASSYGSRPNPSPIHRRLHYLFHRRPSSVASDRHLVQSQCHPCLVQRNFLMPFDGSA